MAPDPKIKSRIENGGVDPKEKQAIERSLKSREQAPTVSEQSSTVDWRQIREQLGQPFDAERISLRKLRQMRRDAMIAFALHYRKTPLVRAPWHIDAKDKDGPNAQIAAFIDSAWRNIHARYIFQHTQDFDFGYQALVKRFALGNPGGVYFDPEEENPENAVKPVWDEGSVDPIIWKPFVALPPERVLPIFNNDGEFDGINYEIPPSVGTAATKKKRGGKQETERAIDVYHSLWATNEKDSVFGSVFGYPVIAHAYRFWWSYWFLWANIDRAYERMAIPPMLAYHPEGDFTDDETGEKMPYWEVALDAAERLRSNAVAAVPSTLATAGLDERGTQQREWDFKFIETPTANFDAMGDHLGYLDIMKLRAVFVPEQAFIEGEGGSSSRNVAAQMAEIFIESQANKWEEIAEHINRFIFPQMLAVNFPEFVNNGGTAKIVGHGFAKEDVEFLKQIIQLIGQGDPASLGVDIREAMIRIGVPIKTQAQLAREQTELVQAQPVGPPQIPVRTGEVGTVPNPGFTAGGSVPQPNAGSVTGFSEPEYIYMNPNPLIELSDHDDFLAALPKTGHYDDKSMRALAVQLRKVWLSALREMYPDFAKYLATQKLELDDEEAIDLADRKSRQKVERLVNRLLKDWSMSSKRLEQVTSSSRTAIERMIKRGVNVASKKLGIKPNIPAETYEEYVETQVGRLIKSVESTTKDNLRSLLINDIMEDKSPDEIARDIRDHFSEFPDWRADRIARSETRDAYNAATLYVAQDAGLKYVKAKDAQKGPTDDICEERDGRLYTIREAWKQMSPKRTHPNDTLEFEPIARAEFSIESVDQLPEDAGDADAWFNAETCTAYIPLDMPQSDADEFIACVLEVI